MFGCKDVEVAGEVESHLGVGEPGATMGMQPPATAEVALPLVNLLLQCIYCLCLSQSLVSKFMVKL